MKRWTAMAQIVAIDHVVVNKKKGVNELDAHRRAKYAVLVGSAGREIPRAHECRAKPFAARQDDIPHLGKRAGDEFVLLRGLVYDGVEVFPKQRIDPLTECLESRFRVGKERFAQSASGSFHITLTDNP
jgi:hypothetical protein